MSTTFKTAVGCTATITRVGDGIGITIAQPSGETKTFALLAAEAREFSILLAMEASNGLNPWAATLLALEAPADAFVRHEADLCPAKCVWCDLRAAVDAFDE